MRIQVKQPEMIGEGEKTIVLDEYYPIIFKSENNKIFYSI
jgi:hypothetical protein